MATGGNKGKFSERLKKILSNRKRKNISKEERTQVEDSNKIYINFLKVVAAIPGLVYENVVDNNQAEEKKIQINRTTKAENATVTVTKEIRKKIFDDNNNIVKRQNFNQNITPKTNQEPQQEFKQNLKKDDTKKENSFRQNFAKGIANKAEKRKIISDISIDKIKKQQEKVIPKSDDKTDNIRRAKELEKSIINLIKKDLIKIVNEMEILQSELYILSEVNGESKELEKCHKELDNVKSMICKIDKLKEQYDFLKDNYDFEYLLEINNPDIVDKIIELRDSFGNNEVKALTEDYKLLEVYQYLYLKIDDLREKTTEFELEKEKEVEKLKERDIDFEKLKQDVYNVDYTNKHYEMFVREQNDILNDIERNVSKIDSHEQVNYHLKGFRELFMNSFKYFGLLMVSPLKGIIPSIATETIITGNIIKNLYRNLGVEEERKIVYESMDYASIISNAISDLESTSNIVDATLDDIVRLKMKYNDKFRKYQGDFTEYYDIMHKINDMENKILGNKIKIEMMKKRALEQQRANEKKLKLVKELNEKK